MREYSFVRLTLVRSRAGTEPETDYREVIRDRAASGWQFVQAISFDGAARPHLDLVFTRKGVQ